MWPGCAPTPSFWTGTATLATPVGDLSDSLEERYSITLMGIAPGEHTVSTRAYDEFDNVAAGKITFTAPIPAGKR